MRLTRQQIEDIRRTHAIVAAEAERLSHLFYDDLFRRDPRLRPLFGPELGHQGMAFMTALDSIVRNLDHDAHLDRLVAELGAIHAPFQIRPRSYRAMEDALIDTMAYALGERMTNAVERAWRSVFGQVGAAMIEAGRRYGLPRPAGAAMPKDTMPPATATGRPGPEATVPPPVAAAMKRGVAARPGGAIRRKAAAMPDAGEKPGAPPRP